MGEELFSADRRTDRYDAHSRFRSFAKMTETSQWMLYIEIIAVCSQTHTKHVAHNVELLNVKSGGMYNNHWATKG